MFIRIWIYFACFNSISTSKLCSIILIIRLLLNNLIEFINSLICGLKVNEVQFSENVLPLNGIRNSTLEVIIEPDISNRCSGHACKSVVSECCLKPNILTNLPDKYVNTVEFRSFTRDLYAKATFSLPSKSVMRMCAKQFLLHSEFNLYSLFSSLANDHLLISEMGFPQLHGSSTLSPSTLLKSTKA
ncbi:unnamed protein product [Heterobilharzia americana]|nr:unnamed protein product [Heterobilharzia americana]